MCPPLLEDFPKVAILDFMDFSIALGLPLKWPHFPVCSTHISSLPHPDTIPPAPKPTYLQSGFYFISPSEEYLFIPSKSSLCIEPRFKCVSQYCVLSSSPEPNPSCSHPQLQYSFHLQLNDNNYFISTLH